jgi:hypothetical protein
MPASQPPHPIDQENARAYALRDALLRFVDARAGAEGLETSEVLMAVNDAYAVMLHRVADCERTRGADREVLYRRAARALVETILEAERGLADGR